MSGSQLGIGTWLFSSVKTWTVFGHVQCDRVVSRGGCEASGVSSALTLCGQSSLQSPAIP